MAQRESCYTCVYAYNEFNLRIAAFWGWSPSRPACANHPESSGRMREVPPCVICPNHRPKPGTPGREARQIPLGDGYYAYVDAEDYEWLSRWTWHLRGGYAVRAEKWTLIFMHREIAKPPEGMIVDHKNRNKLDNTRENLRVCTYTQNAGNRSKRRGTSSEFRGVSYDKKRGKYFAKASCQGERFFLGFFADERDAARAHDHKAVELFGEFARVNFPDEWPPERRAQVYVPRDAVVKAKGGRKKAKARTRSARGGSGAGRTTRSARRTRAKSGKKAKRKTRGARRPRKNAGDA
jgi:hypothetical protein